MDESCRGGSLCTAQRKVSFGWPPSSEARTEKPAPAVGVSTSSVPLMPAESNTADSDGVAPADASTAAATGTHNNFQLCSFLSPSAIIMHLVETLPQFHDRTAHALLPSVPYCSACIVKEIHLGSTCLLRCKYPPLPLKTLPLSHVALFFSSLAVPMTNPMNVCFTHFNFRAFAMLARYLLRLMLLFLEQVEPASLVPLFAFYLASLQNILNVSFLYSYV